MNSINIAGGIPNTPNPNGVSRFSDNAFFEERNYTISGVTKRSDGVAVGSCVVKLFNTATDTVEQSAVSDASGNYSFVVDKTKTWYVVSYLAGAPDIAGTSVNTLAGA